MLFYKDYKKISVKGNEQVIMDFMGVIRCEILLFPIR